MSPQFIDPVHKAIIVDIEEPLVEFQSVLVDYCDERPLVDEMSLLLITMNLLGVSQDMSGSVEAMEIHVKSFCRYQPTPYNEQRLRRAIDIYMRQMRDLFVQCRMYGPDDQLAYTFGRWHLPFQPVFVPYTHIKLYPEARDHIIESEHQAAAYFGNYREVYDPDVANRIYNAALRNEDVIPF